MSSFMKARVFNVRLIRKRKKIFLKSSLKTDLLLEVKPVLKTAPTDLSNKLNLWKRQWTASEGKTWLMLWLAEKFVPWRNVMKHKPESTRLLSKLRVPCLAFSFNIAKSIRLYKTGSGRVLALLSKKPYSLSWVCTLLEQYRYIF